MPFGVDIPIDIPIPGLPPIPGVPGLLDVTGLIADLLGGLFRTHRPDDDELPDGTHWLGNDYSNGVIWMYRHNGVWQFPWVGEVIATVEDDFPVANWSYHYQELMPLAGISRDGACYFIRAHNYEVGIGDPAWRQLVDERCKSVKVGYDFIAQHVARENHTHTMGVTEERGMPWENMIAQMRWYAAAASAHNALGGLNILEKVISLDWYSVQRMKVLK